MDKTGWLVNDYLTCIEGTKTLWHDLLENIDGLKDMCSAPFTGLASRIEIISKENPPDYIIRNASWFREMYIKTKTISLLQDVLSGPALKTQCSVCNNSDLVIYNSWYTKDIYNKGLVKNNNFTVIPVGTDFNHFRTLDIIEKEYDLIFVGAMNNKPKGFDLVDYIIKNTDYRFCLVLKNGYENNYKHDRVDVFNVVDHNKLLELYNKSKVSICTSTQETLHLAGIEAAACGLPIVATDVGIYNKIKDLDGWGKVSSRQNFILDIQEVLHNITSYEPRKVMLSEGLDKESCMEKWKGAVAETCNS